MNDYIKRSDALNFDLEIDCEPDDLQPMMEGMVRVMDYIKQIPAADVAEVVHGEWIDAAHGCGDSPHVICSNCNEYFWRYFKRFAFCPNCGAKLEKAANAIKELPFVSPVVTAKWVKRMEGKTMPKYTSFTPVWSCSACGMDYDPAITPTVHYCPNCGAKMEGGDGDG